jgi:hypothetical protein
MGHVVAGTTYFLVAQSYRHKMFLKLTTGVNVKKTYSSLSLDCKSKPAGVLVTGVIF